MSWLHLRVDAIFFSLHVYGGGGGLWDQNVLLIYMYIEREEVTVDSLRRLASLVIIPKGSVAIYSTRAKFRKVTKIRNLAFEHDEGM